MTAIIRGHRKLFIATSLFLAALVIAPSLQAELECTRSPSTSCVVTANGSRTTDALETRIPLLHEFEIGFARRDRPVRWLTVGTLDGDWFRMAVADRNGGEAITGRAWFRDFAPQLPRLLEQCEIPPDSGWGQIRRATRRGCRGSCDVVVEASPDRRGICGATRFLVGFNFLFTTGRAHKLRQIAVMEHSTERAYQTAFKNDGSRLTYDVELAYVYIPVWRGFTFGIVHTSNSVRVDGRSPDRYPGGGRVEPLITNPEWDRFRYLKGFDVRRRHSDENLLRFAVDLQREYLTVRFEDNDGREDVLFDVWFGEYRVRFE